MLLTRREVLRVAGGLGLALTLGAVLPRRSMAVTADNALERQTLGMYDAWFSWLSGAGAPGYVGETVTPNSEKTGWSKAEVDKWLTLLEKVYAKCDEVGLRALTAHCAGVTSGDSGGFQVYGPNRRDVSLGQRSFVADGSQVPTVEAHPPTPATLRGMNLSAGALDGNSGFGPTHPGTYGTDYTYPNLASLQFLKSRGHNVVRMPFKWERVQPQLNNPLKATEVAHLTDALGAAQQAGIGVIPSVQNYGAYCFSTSSFGVQNLGKIGSSKLPISAYADFMRRLAQAIASHPAVVALDIMNEPRQLQTVSRYPAKLWEQASQAAVSAVREASNVPLWVPGYHTPPKDSYPGLYCFVHNHPAPWITDPAHNFGYTTHCYYGPGSQYPNSYDTVNAMWASKGY